MKYISLGRFVGLKFPIYGKLTFVNLSIVLPKYTRSVST